ncbi:MAG: hypothetical protein R3264_07520 [Anaerolineae bacterium]|nr:hypothetical protein [Anaerolineae bacterium]
MVENVKVGDILNTPMGVVAVAGVNGDEVTLLGIINVIDRQRLDDTMTWSKIKHLCDYATADDFVQDTIERFQQTVQPVGK